MAQVSDIGQRLLDLTQQLAKIPSVSREETEIANFVESRLAEIEHLSTERIGDNLVAKTELGKERRLLLGGHLDTVPHHTDFVVEKTDDSISGPGVVDMKGGLAVMLELAQHIPQNLDLTFLFYTSEEIGTEFSGLREVDREAPHLLNTDAAVLLEPTGGVIEAGCQGTMKLLLKLEGKRAHTARAWKGENAIHKLAPILSAINDYDPRKVEIEGCKFIEAMQVVDIKGGGIGNVVPDVVKVLINIRFAPDKKLAVAQDEAVEFLKEALGSSIEIVPEMSTNVGGDTIQIVDAANSAMPSLLDPLLGELVGGVSQVRAKLGWTDVSFFYDKNISALNFGPGDPELSHTSQEKVSAKELEEVYEALYKFAIA